MRVFHNKNTRVIWKGGKNKKAVFEKKKNRKQNLNRKKRTELFRDGKETFIPVVIVVLLVVVNFLERAAEANYRS